MNPEIKAAIEQQSDKYLFELEKKHHPIALANMPLLIADESFTAGAEYGYKLGLLVGKIEAYTDYNNTEFFEVLLKAEKIKLQELLK